MSRSYNKNAFATKVLLYRQIGTIGRARTTKSGRLGLGHFGDRRFPRPDVSAMVVADVLYEKMSVFEIYTSMIRLQMIYA